jgi:glycosyltransferase involved in cell wall biosynthesis
MKISIVTTAYNIEAYIKKCLMSLVGQTYEDIEIIVVNDCSTDKTMDIVGMFDDERIKVVNHEKNMGAGWARRTGIAAATGEYVITVDGDDWLSEDFIEKLVKNAEETDADIVSGGITYVYDDNFEQINRYHPRISEGMQKFRDYANKKIIFGIIAQIIAFVTNSIYVLLIGKFLHINQHTPPAKTVTRV